MQCKSRPAGIPAGVIQACLDDEPTAALTTQTSTSNYVRRVTFEQVVIVSTWGVRTLELPLDMPVDEPVGERPFLKRPRMRERRSKPSYSSLRRRPAAPIRGSPRGRCGAVGS